jgi:hypothetical protein
MNVPPARSAFRLSRRVLLVSLLLTLATTALRAQSPSELSVEVFDPEFLVGDSAYHALAVASNGQVYFSIGTHEPTSSTFLFRFDPDTENVETLADLSEVTGIDADREIPHGKVHTPMFEHDGALYFATHTSVYADLLPDFTPEDGRRAYQGGHFMRVSLGTGAVESVAAVGLPNEGLISMSLDPNAGMLYGLTWPSGILVGHDLDSGQFHNWGAVQGRGEWGQLGTDWDFICRSLGLDATGRLYGSTNEGEIWWLDRENPRPLQHYRQLDLDAVPAIQAESFAITDEAHFFWRNWRTIAWNPATESFWGIHGGSSQLFEFTPDEGTLRSVHRMIPAGVKADRRNPWRTQLGFVIGSDNTIYYLAHGPPAEASGRPPVRSSVHLLTYQIDQGEFVDHGILTTPDGRRVFFTESLALSPAGDLYTVAWVETTDPARQVAIREARGEAAPDETKEAIYEMQLVRLAHDSAGMAQVRDRLSQN